LLKQGLIIPHVQGVTGHKSVGMTERYNHLEANQITDVMKAQTAIAGTQKPEKEKTPKGLTLVKMPRRKSA